MLVESLQPCAVGTEVICEIPLPGGRRQLRGRVARLQALSPAAVGLAIAFTELDAPDEELLSEAVGQDDGRTHIVHVRFEGMREPMRSRAQLTSDGLRLSTALPFLRLRSPVEVTFLSGPSKVQSRGLVRQVELDQFAADGTPRLAVSVAFAAEPETQPGVPVAVATPAEPVPPVPVVPVAPAGVAAVVAIPTPVTPAPVQPRGLAVTRILLVAAAVVIVGLAALTYFEAGNSGPASAPPVATAPAAAPVAAAPVAAPPAPAAPKIAAAAIAPQVVAAPVTVAPQAPPVVIPPPLPAGTPGPEIVSDGNETTASVPVSGSTQGMVHYSLLRRKGVAVNLPRAQSELPMGLHTIGRDGLRYVWIRERPEGGIQVRFIFSNPAPDERLIELEDDAIKIRVRLHSDVAAQPAAPDGADTVVAGAAVATP